MSPKIPSSQASHPALDAIEHEVVFLRAVFDVIGSMVNYIMMRISGSGAHCEVVFTSDEHCRLFNILLVDFLSQTDAKGPVASSSYMKALSTVVAHPQFGADSIDALARATRDFADWLETEVEVDIYFPSLDANPTLHIRRETFLRICGNIAKHNFLRLMRVASQLQGILTKQGIIVSIEQSALALAEFDGQMRSIVNYYSSNIAELLNNLRWGIYEYLRPEFCRSYRRIPGDEFRYEYDYPMGVNNQFARTCYWDLMNELRSQPYMPRFQTERRSALRFP